MRIVITGSRGCIGSNLVKHLKKNHEIIGLNKNPDTNCHNYRCIDLSNISEVSHVYSDLKKSNQIPDLLIHCAATANPQPTPENLSKFIDVNIKSAFNISQYFQCSIINFSSIVVYGHFDWSYQKTEYHNTSPISLYGITKLAAENIFNLYSNVLNLRLGTTVGPNLTHGVVRDICNRLKNEDKFYVYGKQPGSVKPFLYISDLLDLIDIIINDDIKVITNNLNIVNNDNISVEEVAIACMQALGIKKEIEWDQSKIWTGDNQIINASNKEIYNICGWKPKYSSYDAVMKAVCENYVK